MKDETGKRFGKLITICKVKDSKGYYTRYKCLCDCGNQHIVATTHLRKGSITHCGCNKILGAKHTQWKGVGEISGNFWWTHIIRSANGSKLNNRTRKPKELTISIEYAWNLFILQNRKCALTGIILKFPKKYKDKDYTASLDRIDSSKGYVEGNVQWVHKHINIMKNKFDNQYFIDMCKKVAGGACSVE